MKGKLQKLHITQDVLAAIKQVSILCKQNYDKLKNTNSK